MSQAYESLRAQHGNDKNISWNSNFLNNSLNIPTTNNANNFSNDNNDDNNNKNIMSNNIFEVILLNLSFMVAIITTISLELFSNIKQKKSTCAREINSFEPTTNSTDIPK